MIDAQGLEKFAMLRRQLRDIAGIVETRPGVFSCAGSPMVELVSNAGKVSAQFRGAGSSMPVMRFDLEDPLASRKLLDETKRRVAKQVDD